MSGVTDLPFRRLAWRAGAGLVVTEMIASRELVNKSDESCLRLAGTGIDPHMVQLAGREPAWMAEGARLAVELGADIIDINMGCPAKKVTGGYAGSALMRDPALALSIIEATVDAVAVPVTLKMRLGWDDSSLNAAEIARNAESAGVRMITVHGRTRCQFYDGRADWEAIARVRDAVSVPFVANGDVATSDDASRILELTGADALMVGRAAQGQPWLPGELAGLATPPATPDEVSAYVEAHYRDMLDHYAPTAGLRHARKHLGWYLQRFAPDCPADLRIAIMTGTQPEEVLSALEEAFHRWFAVASAPIVGQAA